MFQPDCTPGGRERDSVASLRTHPQELKVALAWSIDSATGRAERQRSRSGSISCKMDKLCFEIVCVRAPAWPYV